MSKFHLINRLAEFVQSDELPYSDNTVDIIRRSVIDTFGCILSGSREDISVRCRRAFGQLAGGSTPIFGTAETANPETAALINAAAGHSLDLDDWELPGNSHSSVVIVPALFAASNQALSAPQFIESYVVGFELIARFGEAINFEHYSRGWHTTSTLATIGATASVSRLWGLDKEATANALSLAVSKASGLTRQFGSHAKALQAGFAAENGVRCSRLAKFGLTGQPHVLEGNQGYFSLTAHDDSRRYYRPFENLGKILALDEHGQMLKPYPSCGYTHRIIDCAKKLKTQGVETNSIQKINLFLPDFHAAILPFRQPKNRREALFSLPYCASMGLLYGRLTVDDLDQETWKENEISRLISLIKICPYTPNRGDLNYDPEQPDCMKIHLNDGTMRSASIHFPSGSPQNPMSENSLIRKFLNNASRFRTPNSRQLEELKTWTQSENLLPVFYKIGLDYE